MVSWNPTRWIWVLLAVWVTGVAGCGGSGSGSTADIGGCVLGDASTSSQCGTVVVAVTDADGDFASYTVDVVSIEFSRADGSRVEMLPRSARIDFAQLSTLAELISAATVVPGDFVGGHIRIDYSDAEIYVESNGGIVPANVYTADGTLLTAATPNSVVDLEIVLPQREHLIVTRGRTSLLSLDFDLAVSHLVDLSTDPVSVVAAPYLVAEVDPVDRKEIRVRGALLDVDLESGTYAIELRPWHHRDGDYGSFTVVTDPGTEYEIDGNAFTGPAGLRALSEQPSGTLTEALGTFDLETRTFTADLVHAGESLGGDQFSAVVGNIVARRDDRLIMKGALVIRRDRRAHVHRTVIIDIGPDTEVAKTGDSATRYGSEDLSVGQRVILLGTVVNSDLDTSDRFGPDVALMLDARQGRARMLVTRLTGSLNAAAPGLINITVRAIDGLGIDLFDFTGTGRTSELDANPQDYAISTSNLSLDGIDALTAIEPLGPVSVLGFVAPFGAAPPDFEGRTLISPPELPAVLGVAWGSDGTATPFSVMGPQSLVIDLSEPAIGLRHHLLIGDHWRDLYDLPASPGITESRSPRIFGIAEPRHVELFKDFADFVDALALRLSAADRALSLTAYGQYHESENSLVANKIVVHVRPAESSPDSPSR